jgi:hypothetical protein
MDCPGELTLSMLADGAAADPVVDTHLADCAKCRARLAALSTERAALSAALADDPYPVVVPPFQKPLSRGAMLAAAAVVLGLAALVSAAPALLAALLPEALTDFDPLDIRIIAKLTVRAVLFVANNGGDIMSAIVTTASAGAGIGLLGWALYAWRRRVSGPLLIVMLALAGTLEPAPVHALDVRRAVEEGNVIVPAGETIDDTLIAVGGTIEIDGDVTGDLIVAGRRVIVRGRIGGQVYAAGQDVTVESEIGAGILAAGESVEVSSPRIGGNLYGFGQRISLAQGANVTQNAIAFGERVLISGTVGKDVIGFGNEVEVDATVGRDVVTRANRTMLFRSARIAGDVRTAGDPSERLTVSPGAVVGGALIDDGPFTTEPASRYLTLGFYVAQLLRFAAAFVTGALLFALVPQLRELGFKGARATLISSGIGLVTIVAAPAIAAIVAVTVVGLPLAAAGFFVWLAGIYLAKVLVANYVGRYIMRSTGAEWHYTVALALGLVIVLAVVNIPFIGGILDFVATVAGFGLIAQYVWRAIRPARPTGAATAV